MNLKRRMTLTMLALFLVCSNLTSCQKESKEKISDVTEKNDNLYSCNFNGVEHEFLVCDSTIQEESPKPLIIMLHEEYGNHLLQ